MPFLLLDVLEPFFRKMFTLSTAQLFSFGSFKNMFDWFSLTFIEYNKSQQNNNDKFKIFNFEVLFDLKKVLTKGGPQENIFIVQNCILEYTMNLVSVVKNWFSGLFTFNLIRLMSKQ